MDFFRLPYDRAVTGSEEMDELTPAELEELKAAVRALISQLEVDLEEARLGSRPVTLDQQSVGRVSRIDAIQQQNMSAASVRSLQRRLGQTKAAWSALEHGAYGACRDCEEPIGYRRLRARPETPLCLQCQNGRETRQSR